MEQTCWVLGCGPIKKRRALTDRLTPVLAELEQKGIRIIVTDLPRCGVELDWAALAPGAKILDREEDAPPPPGAVAVLCSQAGSQLQRARKWEMKKQCAQIGASVVSVMV